MVYAVVRAGGRQEKVEVGDVVQMDRVADKDGDDRLAAGVLLVDGDAVTPTPTRSPRSRSPPRSSARPSGPKIVIQKFKNKTGYKKRQGHRQELTRVKITGIK